MLFLVLYYLIWSLSPSIPSKLQIDLKGANNTATEFLTTFLCPIQYKVLFGIVQKKHPRKEPWRGTGFNFNFF